MLLEHKCVHVYMGMSLHTHTYTHTHVHTPRPTSGRRDAHSTYLWALALDIFFSLHSFLYFPSMI